MRSGGRVFLCVVVVFALLGQLAPAGEASEGAHLAQDVTAASPANGGDLLLDSTSAFLPGPGVAMIDPGNSTKRETISYNGVGSHPPRLFGITRSQPLDHLTGAEVLPSDDDSARDPTSSNGSSDRAHTVPAPSSANPSARGSGPASDVNVPEDVPTSSQPVEVDAQSSSDSSVPSTQTGLPPCTILQNVTGKDICGMITLTSLCDLSALLCDIPPDLCAVSSLLCQIPPGPIDICPLLTSILGRCDVVPSTDVCDLSYPDCQVLPAPPPSTGVYVEGAAECVATRLPCDVEDATLGPVSDAIPATNTPGSLVWVPLSESSGAQPRSASRCDDRVCIIVFGESSRVDRWYTRARQYKSDGCVAPTVYFEAETRSRPGSGEFQYVAIDHYPGQCVRGDGYWYYDLPSMPRYFGPNGRHLMNEWYPFGGAPQIEIKM